MNTRYRPVTICKSLGTTSSLNSILPKTCRTEPLSPAQRKRGTLLIKKWIQMTLVFLLVATVISCKSRDSRFDLFHSAIAINLHHVLMDASRPEKKGFDFSVDQLWERWTVALYGQEWQIVNANKDFFMECKQDNPDIEIIQKMYTTGNWLIIPDTGKELSLKMEATAFKNAFLSLVGGVPDEN